jgi:DNA repair protein RadD
MKKKGLRSEQDRFLKGPLSTSRYSSDQAITIYRESSIKITNDEDVFQSEELAPCVSLVNPGRGFLFDYQRELVDGMANVVKSEFPENVALVALPTGGGKTRTAVWAILELLGSGVITRPLWLAPTRELLEQALVTFQAIWQIYPSVDSLSLVRFYAGGRTLTQNSRFVSFMTPQMLHQMTQKNPSYLGRSDLIVFDEAHHALAPTYQAAVKTRRPKTTALVGLSATPGRATEEGTEGLVELFGKRLVRSTLLGEQPVEALRERGILSQLEFHRIELDRHWPGLVIERKGGGKSGRELEVNASRFDAVVSKCIDLSRKGKVLVFAGSISHANALAAVLLGSGVSAASISSQTPDRQRRETLTRFENGEIRVLVNKQLLATGYDCPTITDAVLSVPISSPILFEQIVGRISRGPKVGGNDIGRVWQIDDNLRINGYPSSYYRFRDFNWE